MLGLAWLAQQWSDESGDPFAGPRCSCSYCEEHRGKVRMALWRKGMQ